MMQLEVTLFAAARELAGTESVQLSLAPGGRAADLLAALEDQVPALAEMLPVCRLAVDCQYVPPDHILDGGQEIALIPPVSGG